MTDKNYSFTINGGYTPKTIPMERLAEYMTGLARMMGEEAYVHFDSVVEGSVALKARVDEPAQPKVRERVQAVRSGSAPVEIRKHFEALDEMLRRDNAFATLAGGEGVVVPFPGRNRPEPAVFGPFRQRGTIDGEVYRIGGKDSTKHVNIRSSRGDLSVLWATEAVARRLLPHCWTGILRFSGEGSWIRHGDGRWELKTFRIDDFELLDDASLLEVVARLRAVGGHELGEDPLTALLAERHGVDGEAA